MATVAGARCEDIIFVRDVFLCLNDFVGCCVVTSLWTYRLAYAQLHMYKIALCLVLGTCLLLNQWEGSITLEFVTV